jgi:hypothetical protein
MREGIDIKKLKPGTTVVVTTVHSIYKFLVTETPGEVIAIGGEFIKESTKVRFNGSTMNGSAIKPGWIMCNMHMEISHKPNHIITTSLVKSAKIIGNGWEYSLNWS